MKAASPDRSQDRWPAHKVDALLAEIRAFAPWVVVSGGFAWHMMAPSGHEEYRMGHDHKDIDLFVPPAKAQEFLPVVATRGYKRVWTRFDRLPSAEDFRRYERHIPTEQGPVKAQIDCFLREVPFRMIDGLRVIEPAFLLTLYKTIHGSKTAWAVRQAARLLDQGVDPQGRVELTQRPSF